MRYFTNAIVVSALIFFIYDIYRQIKKDKKIVWKNIRSAWIGILLSVMVLLQRFNPIDAE